MDYPVYKRAFETISRGGKVEEFEILYHKLNEVIAFCGGDFKWLFAITSVLFCIIVFKTIFRDSPIPTLSVFLLVATTYYFCFFNGIRSMLAYAITLFSLKYVTEQKFIPFLISIFIAGGFHTTAFLFGIVYFIYNKQFRNTFVLFSTIGMFVLAPILGKCVNYIINLTKYEHFLESDYVDAKQGYVKLLIIVIVTIFANIYYDKEDKKFQLYYKLQVISMWLTAFVPYVPLISRVRWMFGLPVIILIPLIVSKIKDTKTQFIIRFILIALYSVYCGYNLIVYNTNNVLPYRTIFELNP